MSNVENIASQKTTAQPTQQDLVQLQPDTESIFKRLIGPKIIILTFLSLIFISKNIYNIYVIGPSDTPRGSVNQSHPVNVTSEASQDVPQDDSIMERMYGYCILTAVLFVLYIMLVRANDRALMKKIQDEKNKEQEQERQRIRKLRKNEDQTYDQFQINQEKQNAQTKTEAQTKNE